MWVWSTHFARGIGEVDARVDEEGGLLDLAGPSEHVAVAVQRDQV
jgi:hypothetical protein